MVKVPEEAKTITYQRRPRKRKRPDIMAAFPIEEIHHELSNTNCPDCHQALKEIGSYTVRQELLFIPAQIKRLNHIQHAYKCEYCSQINDADKIIKAALPIAMARLRLLHIAFIRNMKCKCRIIGKKATGKS